MGRGVFGVVAVCDSGEDGESASVSDVHIASHMSWQVVDSVLVYSFWISRRDYPHTGNALTFKRVHEPMHETSTSRQAGSDAARRYVSLSSVVADTASRQLHQRRRPPARTNKVNTARTQHRLCTTTAPSELSPGGAKKSSHGPADAVRRPLHLLRRRLSLLRGPLHPLRRPR